MAHLVEGAPHDVLLTDDDLCACLSEREIHSAICQLNKRRAPGWDEVSAEMLKMGRYELVKWLKILAD